MRYGHAFLAILLGLAAACGDDDGSGTKTNADAGSKATARQDASTPVRGGQCGDEDAGSSSCDDGYVCIDGACVTNKCGDGVRAEDEVCDDHNLAAGDGCGPDCRPETSGCGDRIVQEGEECDDGNRFDADACTNQCKENVCGNGRLDGVEECDDGNMLDDDDCSDACTENRCRNGRLDPGEECDDGNQIQHDGCTNACKIVECGNEEIEEDEECDDGNRVDDDDCSNECTSNECGNGRVDPGEACDGLSCAPDCKSTAPDTCRPCEELHCRNYRDFWDAVAACYDGEPNPEIVADPDNKFGKDCLDYVTCSRKNHCGAGGSADCYCGSADPATTCLNDGPAADAPCLAETQRAARTSVNQEIFTQLSDVSFPSGWAQLLIDCDIEFCNDECRP